MLRSAAGLRCISLSCILLACVLLVCWPAGAIPAATLSGFVYDIENGEALSHADVYLQETPYGDMTNEKGYYVIPDLPAGGYKVAFSYMGYKLEVRFIMLAENEEIELDMELTPQPILLETVEVKAGHDNLVLETGRLTLRTRELVQMPAAVEVDLFRSIQMLPGVTTLSDYSSGLYVRGGSPDQNLILLDDVDVYNPSHLFGFFSTFNVDAVKSVELQKGGFPARYGGRLSSLLDVHNRDGNRRKFEGVGRYSTISASTTLEGPWRHGSWMVSGRHTFIEQLARRLDIDLPYKFYDVHGRFNADIGKNDRSSLSYYRGRDKLDWDQEGLDVLLDWGNDTWSAQYTHLFSSRLFSHTLIGGSRYSSIAEVTFQDFDMRMKNEIRDLSTKSNLSFTPNRDHLIDFGVEAKLLDFGFNRRMGDDSNLDFKYSGIYSALYGQDSWRLSPQWQIQPGLRLDYYSEGSYFNLNPRLKLLRRINERVSLHATYGRYTQYLNLVAAEDASFTSMWFPVDETLDPGTADHFILGLELGPYDHFDLSLEGYYKPYHNLVEFNEEFGESLIEEDAQMGEVFNSGSGNAYGTDLYLRNNIHGFEGWLGYTWGVAHRTITHFNFSKEFQPSYDRRHQIVAVQDYNLAKHWRLNFIFKYGSGQPTTLAVGRYTAMDIMGREYDTVLYGAKNTSRLPAYHRLDAGITYHTKSAGMSVEVVLQIINVYNHENVYIRSYDMTENPVKYNDITMLPLLPTIGINVTF